MKYSDKLISAIQKAAKMKNYRLVDDLEKMLKGSLPVNYAIIDRVLSEEESINDRINKTQEMISDIDSKMADADEDKRKSLELHKKVLQSRMAELRNKASQPVEEEAPYQKLRFLDTDNDGNPIEEEHPEDCDCPECKPITEGCMDKKFESMTNRDIANYIFKHPHTKFGEKIKECDTNEMMKAIRDMAKEHEVKKLEEEGEGGVEANVTTTDAIEYPEVPWGLGKRKKKQ